MKLYRALYDRMIENRDKTSTPRSGRPSADEEPEQTCKRPTHEYESPLFDFIILFFVNTFLRLLQHHTFSFSSHSDSTTKPRLGTEEVVVVTKSLYIASRRRARRRQSFAKQHNWVTGGYKVTYGARGASSSPSLGVAIGSSSASSREGRRRFGRYV
ncbi:hypothetical protein BDY19DRAFT_701510 [Irpex rosettiformis]|uniref:Uncharacterized protein n=1 Tax=Irpex rosettiformis TaxID=378272 RepID=A0ACB8TN20_9APHY|nr:hypothetical protein BDY19DRAFT_701510 [Irpex rosettiformis]